ncbi:MAG: transposase [Anaerolineae bacterium]
MAGDGAAVPAGGLGQGGGRRARVRVPEDVAFQTKPEIALGIVDLARAWGVPFKYAVADAGYGDNPHCLEGLEGRQCLYVCGVESTFGLRLPQEVRAAVEGPPPPTRAEASPRRDALPLCTRPRP